MQPVLSLEEFLNKMYRDSRIQLEPFQDILEDTVQQCEVGVTDEDFNQMEKVITFHCKNVIWFKKWDDYWAIMKDEDYKDVKN